MAAPYGTKPIKIRAAAILAALPIAQPAYAQTASPIAEPRPAAEQASGWSVTIGAASIVSPVWQGSRDMAFSIFPDLRFRYRDELFASIPEGAGWNAVNDNGWKAGPIAKLRFGRDENSGGSPFLIAGKSDVLVGLGNIDANSAGLSKSA